MAEWPACTKWASLAWWARTHGHRSVPVELGVSGTPGWREAVLPLGRFVAEHLTHPAQEWRLPPGSRPECASHALPPRGGVGDAPPAVQTLHAIESGMSCSGGDTGSDCSSTGTCARGSYGSRDETGMRSDGGQQGLPGSSGDGSSSRGGSSGACEVAYLAQHPLLEQLPALLADIRVPSYCGPAGACITNVWIGNGAAQRSIRPVLSGISFTAVIEYAGLSSKWLRQHSTTVTHVCKVWRPHARGCIEQQCNSPHLHWYTDSSARVRIHAEYSSAFVCTFLSSSSTWTCGDCHAMTATRVHCCRGCCDTAAFRLVRQLPVPGGLQQCSTRRRWHADSRSGQRLPLQLSVAV